VRNTIALFIILVFIPLITLAGSLEFKSGNKKSKQDYQHSKCVNETTKYKQKLTYQETCKYGTTCPEKKMNGKTLMYCTYTNISQCFENKAWKTSNELVGISSKIKIGLLTQGLSFKKGADTGQTCAFYD
jgi:antitoxin component YwqK of YwqJK toxin-antitoxin module